MTRTGLGRGLAALLPDEDAQPFQNLPIQSIRPNPRQPRERFDSEELEALSDSIRRLGVLQPLIVRAISGAAAEGVTGEYELIAGERRLRAAQLAGLDTVPTLVKEVSDEESLEQALLENVHRENLNPLEEAAAYRQLIEDFDLTHEAVAARVGKSRAAITNALRLLGLPAPVQELVANGKISGGHARAIASLDDPLAQIELARRVLDDDLSVRQTEEAARPEGRVRNQRKVTPKAVAHPALLEVGELMGDYLNTSVDVAMGRGSGRITIEFGSFDDLERIAQTILGPFDD